ncbi:ABC transporter permease [Angustibacter luteus]|uniref:ABC transporter permease n=1 Tax=Angustibacter luteus TaxID=658456 RepID=A0ABW1JFF0_9ACTN
MASITDVDRTDRAHRSVRRRLSAHLFRSDRTRLAGLVGPPVAWMAVIYFAAVFSLLSTAFFSVDEFTNAVVRTFTTANLVDVFTEPAYLRATLLTVGIAASVTVLCIVIGLPMAFFMAKVARRRSRGLLLALVITPLWASYLVKVYAWQAMVQPGRGVIAWMLQPFGLDGPGFGRVAIVLTLTYLWLPYMILPVFAGLERLPDSLLDASGDLGARPWRTFRSVVLPLVYPSIIAGTIFTFSLSLGDYITAQIVGGKVQMLGNIVYQNYAANLPFAATIALIPIAIMLVYLAVIRRSGALDNL